MKAYGLGHVKSDITRCRYTVPVVGCVMGPMTLAAQLI